MHPEELPDEELLDVVVFAPPLGERGTGEQGISPGTDLRGDMPAGKLTDTCPWVRFPHRDLRSLTEVRRGAASQGPGTWLRVGGSTDERPTGGDRWSVPRAPIHRASGCVSAGIHHTALADTDWVPERRTGLRLSL